MKTGRYAIHRDEAAAQRAYELCRGQYQRDIITGHEAVSGVTLKGEARQNASRYRRSVDSLIARLISLGIPISETVGPDNRRILVIG